MNLEREGEMLKVPIYEERDQNSYQEGDEENINFFKSKSRYTQNKIKYRRSDIKTLLIDLYGSRESFLAEYENFLAEKILYF